MPRRAMTIVMFGGLEEPFIVIVAPKWSRSGTVIPWGFTLVWTTSHSMLRVSDSKSESLPGFKICIYYLQEVKLI